MRLLTKCMASGLAIAVAGCLSIGSVQALTKPGHPSVKSTAQNAAGKKAKRSAWKSCGVGKYHDKKTGKCADASAKK